jgi:hypothetical protein
VLGGADSRRALEGGGRRGGGRKAAEVTRWRRMVNFPLLLFVA